MIRSRLISEMASALFLDQRSEALFAAPQCFLGPLALG